MMEYCLLKASLTASTRKAESFDYFCSQTLEVDNFPADSVTVSCFIAYLYMHNFAASAISSHLSAISFFHKLKGFLDHCQDFVTQVWVVEVLKFRA